MSLLIISPPNYIGYIYWFDFKQAAETTRQIITVSLRFSDAKKCNSHGCELLEGVPPTPTLSEFIHSAQTREAENTRSGAAQRSAAWKATPVKSPERWTNVPRSGSRARTIRTHIGQPQHWGSLNWNTVHCPRAFCKNMFKHIFIDLSLCARKNA